MAFEYVAAQRCQAVSTVLKSVLRTVEKNSSKIPREPIPFYWRYCRYRSKKQGHDIGMVTRRSGELVKVQMKRKKVDLKGEEVLKVYRKASQNDIDKWQKCRDREEEIKKRAREIAIILNLQMKISDVEFQGDGSKATFLLQLRKTVSILGSS